MCSIKIIKTSLFVIKLLALRPRDRINFNVENGGKETYLAVDLLELWVVLVHLEVKFRGRHRDNARSHDTGRDQFSFRADVHRA